MSDIVALNLLLDANYVGRSAFGSMIRDIEGVVAATNSLSRVGRAFSAVGDVMIATGLAVAAGLTYAVKAASEYETAINRITSVTPDLQNNVKLIAQLNSQIGTTGSQYGLKPTDVAQGSYFLFSSLGALGATSGQLLGANVINQLAQYTRASGWPNEGGISFGDAAQVLPRLFAASGAPLGQWGGDMGTLTFLENRAHMTQEQLANAMNAFLPAMTSLGINFEDSATLMAGVATAGRTGAPGGRETLSALTLMLSGSKQQEALKGIGLSSQQFFDKSGKMLPIDQVLNMLRTGIYGHAKSPADVLATEHALFGQVGLRALGPLLAPEGWAKYQNLLKEEKGTGIYGNNRAAGLYMRQVADSMMQSPGAQWDRFLATMQLLAITVGTRLLPSLMRFGNALDAIALKLIGFINAHPTLAGNLAMAAVPALLGGGFGMKGMGGFLHHIGLHDEGVLARNTRGQARYVEDMAAHTKRVEHWTTARAGVASRLESNLNALHSEAQAEGLGLYVDKHGNLRQRGIGRGIKGSAEQRMKARNYLEAHKNALAQADEELAALGGMPTAPKAFKAEKTLAEHLLSPWKSIAGAGSRAGGRAASTLALVGRGLRNTEDVEANNFFASGFGLNAPLGKAFGAIGSVAAHPLKSIVSLGKGIGELATGGFGMFLNLLKAAPAALLSFGGAAIPIIAIILAIVGAITIIVLLFTRFRTEGQRLAQFFGGIFGPLFHQVLGMLHEQFLRLQKTWKEVEPQVQKGMHELVNAIISAKPFFQALGSFIVFVLGLIITAIGGLVRGFIKALPFIIGFFAGIFRVVGDVTKLIIAIFTGKWSEIPKILGNLMGDIWSTVSNGFLAIVNFLWGFIQNVLGFFHHLWDELVGHSIIPDMINSIIDWFTQLPGRALTAVQGLLDNLITFFTNLQTSAIAWGKNIIQGIIDGVGSMGRALTSAMQAAAGSAMNSFKNTLGIHSPSSVFHHYGQMVVLGYTTGIQSKQSDVRSVHSMFGLGSINSLHVGNLHLPGQQDNLDMYRFNNYADAQRQRRMGRYTSDLDSLAYQERIGAQYSH